MDIEQLNVISDEYKMKMHLSNNETVQNVKNEINYELTEQNLEQAINQQKEPPLVDVGPLSPKRKVPVYVRSKKPFSSRHVYNQETSGGSHEDLKSERPSKKKCQMTTSSELAKLSKRYFPRQWEWTTFGKEYRLRPESHRGFDFTIMSYNVLAQELLERHSYLYYKCYPSDLEWHNRWRLILDEIKFHSPDILCLQEVNEHHYNSYFKTDLKPLGYRGTFFCRTGTNTDGCATIYKTSKFRLKDTIPVSYSKPEGGQFLDRDNVALIVKLAPKSSSVPDGRLLCVANTHLLYSPKRGDIKLAQLTMLLAELDKHGRIDGRDSPYRHHALIVCGDFNSLPDSAVYELVVRGKLYYSGLPRGMISGQERGDRARRSPQMDNHFLPESVGIDRYCRFREESKSSTKDLSESTSGKQNTGQLKHGLRLVSAYDHFVGRKGPYSSEATTCHDEPCTVDYIFYNVESAKFRSYRGSTEVESVDEAQLQLIGHFGLITDTEFKYQGSIPNHKLGSDHLSIMAKFALR